MEQTINKQNSEKKETQIEYLENYKKTARLK